jgi:hypothetical protein
MSFLRSPQYKRRITIETPVPPSWLKTFHLQDAVADVHYELSGERDDPFEGIPFNDRRIFAILMTEYAQFKLPPYKRDKAFQYFMQTDREN